MTDLRDCRCYVGRREFCNDIDNIQLCPRGPVCIYYDNEDTGSGSRIQFERDRDGTWKVSPKARPEEFMALGYVLANSRANMDLTLLVGARASIRALNELSQSRLMGGFERTRYCGFEHGRRFRNQIHTLKLPSTKDIKIEVDLDVRFATDDTGKWIISANASPDDIMAFAMWMSLLYGNLDQRAFLSGVADTIDRLDEYNMARASASYGQRELSWTWKSIISTLE